jgi:hypothetical protein
VYVAICGIEKSQHTIAVWREENMEAEEGEMGRAEGSGRQAATS